MDYLLKLSLIILVLFLFIYKELYKKQEIIVFNYNDNDNYRYLCNTFMCLNTPPNKGELLIEIRARVNNIAMLQEKKTQNNLIITDSLKKFERFIISPSSHICWRIICYFNKTYMYIVFQNHRSLCGGQKRLWNIINYILDNPIKTKQNKVKKQKKPDFPAINDIITSNPLVNTISLLMNKKVIEGKKRGYIIKDYHKKLYSNICKKYNCSMNDLAIALVTDLLIKSKTLKSNTINVFIPFYIDGEYSYYILNIPNTPTDFNILVKYISDITKRTIRNPYIKKLSLYTTKLVSLLPSPLYYKIYKNTMNNIHIFISNVVGFNMPRTIKGHPISNIYQMYSSYNRIIEAGVSSYNDIFTIAINYDTRYIKI